MPGFALLPRARSLSATRGWWASTYWRSWWNYPPVPEELVASLKPDFIYLTHLHWDHFQSVSLKRFDPETPVLIPYDRYERFTRDLRKIGMRNVRELRHGERVELAPGFAIRSFHFAPFVTDSAVAIEAEGVTLLNANDAKFAGAPLDQILRLYPKIDFCLRSHSSANPRACYHYLDSPDEQPDDNEHYVRAFALFMARVKPRYAIPFASNSCLLHDDVYRFNHLTQTPNAVAEYFNRFAEQRGLATKLQIMIPGDKWDSESGFMLQDHDWFEDRETKLASYRDRVGPALDRQAQFEARVQVSPKLVQDYFADLARDVPASFTRKLKGREVLLVSRSEKGTGRICRRPRRRRTRSRGAGGRVRPLRDAHRIPCGDPPPGAGDEHVRACRDLEAGALLRDARSDAGAAPLRCDPENGRGRAVSVAPAPQSSHHSGAAPALAGGAALHSGAGRSRAGR